MLQISDISIDTFDIETYNLTIPDYTTNVRSGIPMEKIYLKIKNVDEYIIKKSIYDIHKINYIKSQLLYRYLILCYTNNYKVLDLYEFSNHITNHIIFLYNVMIKNYHYTYTIYLIKSKFITLDINIINRITEYLTHIPEVSDKYNKLIIPRLYINKESIFNFNIDSINFISYFYSEGLKYDFIYDNYIKYILSAKTYKLLHYPKLPNLIKNNIISNTKKEYYIS